MTLIKGGIVFFGPKNRIFFLFDKLFTVISKNVFQNFHAK